MLRGVRVAVTRRRGAELVAWLEEAGAEVLWLPAIGVGMPDAPEVVEGAAKRVGWYDWVVFTSVTGVERFVEALAGVGGGAAALEEVRVACIGPATAAAVEELGLNPAVVPEAAVAESLLEALVDELIGQSRGEGGGRELEGVRVLLPVAAGARRVIERGLAERGALVHRVETYRTVPDATGLKGLVDALSAKSLDVVTFASPSAVEFFVSAAGGRARELLEGVLVAVIGPVTAEAARGLGVAVDIEASEYTARGLLRALEEHYTKVS